jgi:hypothetical protein
MLALRRDPVLTEEVEKRFIELIQEFTDNVYMLQYHAEELHKAEEEEKGEKRTGLISLKD